MPFCDPNINDLEKPHPSVPVVFGAHPYASWEHCIWDSDVWLSPATTVPGKMRSRCSTVKSWQGCRAVPLSIGRAQFACFNHTLEVKFWYKWWSRNNNVQPAETDIATVNWIISFVEHLEFILNCARAFFLPQNQAEVVVCAFIWLLHRWGCCCNS